jgi:hypothetical protein
MLLTLLAHKKNLMEERFFPSSVETEVAELFGGKLSRRPSEADFEPDTV